MAGTGVVDRPARLLAMLSLVLLIAGCGGNGGDNDPPPVDDPSRTLVWDEVNWDQGTWQ